VSASACSDWTIHAQVSQVSGFKGQFFLQAHRGEVRPSTSGTPTAPERVATGWHHPGELHAAEMELESLIAKHEAGIP